MIEIAGIEIASQAIVSGLVSGLIYAAFAAGFVLIYRSTGVLNFAQGEQGAFGLALFVLLNANYDVPWWAAFVLAVVGSAVVGALVGVAPRPGVVVVGSVNAGAVVKPEYAQIRVFARDGWARELRALCREHGVVFQAYSPLGRSS